MNADFEKLQISSALSATYDRVLRQFDDEHVNFRIWAKDATLFSLDKKPLMFDWLNEPEDMLNNVKSLHDLKNHLFEFIVLLGMGGSSLSARVFQDILAKNTAAHFFVVDTIHPDAMAELLKKIDVKRTLFIVASKSGTTLEPMLLYRYFLSVLDEKNVSDPYAHFLAITDPVTDLEQESSEHGFLKGPFGKPGIGGRYSALSCFGIFPALLMNVDVKTLLTSAVDEMHRLGPSVLARHNEAAQLAAFFAASFEQGHDKLFMHFSQHLYPLASWLEQLIAESLGKRGQGLVPIVAENYHDHPTALHLFLGFSDELLSLHKIKKNFSRDTPLYRMTIDNPYELSSLMFRMQMAVTFFAAARKINPFDQPDVERSKVRTKEIIDDTEKIALLKSSFIQQKNLSLSENTSDFLSHVKADDYLAILSFLDETQENTTKLEHLKNLLSKKTQVPVMVQTGPRYLHSTGQLFKGGKNNGHFLMITGPYVNDFTTSINDLKFSHVHKSQALGDFLTLKELHRRVLYVDMHHMGLGFKELHEEIARV